MWHGHCLLLLFQAILSKLLESFLTTMHCSVFYRYSRDTHYTSLWVSLNGVTSSLVPCPVVSGCLDLPRFSIFSPQRYRQALFICFSLFTVQLRVGGLKWHLNIYRVCLFRFSFRLDHFPSLPNVPTLENYLYIYLHIYLFIYVFVIILHQRVNIVNPS